MALLVLILLLVLLPIIIRLFQEGSFETFQMGLLASLFLLMLAISSRRIHNTVIDGLHTKQMFLRATDKMKQQAYYDELTKLPNRRLLRDRLLQALSRAERSHMKGALLFLDIDHFKNYNYTYGHLEGDKVARDELVEGARALQHATALRIARQRHTLATAARRAAIAVPTLLRDAKEALVDHPWWGNVRELKNLAQRMVLTLSGTTKRSSIFASR